MTCTLQKMSRSWKTKNHYRLKGNKETWQLNAICDSGMGAIQDSPFSDIKNIIKKWLTIWIRPVNEIRVLY